MIVLDSSALIAILQDEPEGQDFAKVLVEEDRRVISAATWLEAAMVWEGKRLDVGQSRVFDRLIHELGLEVVPVTAEHARIARDAFKRYGKGRGRGSERRHPKLNFGDCFAYALAKALDAPLLFKGGDFAATDVKRA